MENKTQIQFIFPKQLELIANNITSFKLPIQDEDGNWTPFKIDVNITNIESLKVIYKLMKKTTIHTKESKPSSFVFSVKNLFDGKITVKVQKLKTITLPTMAADGMKFNSFSCSVEFYVDDVLMK